MPQENEPESAAPNGLIVQPELEAGRTTIPPWPRHVGEAPPPPEAANEAGEDPLQAIESLLAAARAMLVKRALGHTGPYDAVLALRSPNRYAERAVDRLDEAIAWARWAFGR